MQVIDFGQMKGGWFIGNFEPTALKTEDFEVCWKLHKQGEFWPRHYHRVATEYNLLVEGKMRIKDAVLEAPCIFVLQPNEVADPEFLEDCKIVIVKTPSVIGDKYEV